MVHRHQFVALACTAVVVGGLALTGCGANASTASTTTAAPATSTTRPATSAPTTSAPVTDPSTTGLAPTAPATDGAVQIKIVSTPYGEALGSIDGRVLYAWDKEASGTVVCLDAACLEKWPPLIASSVTTPPGIDPALFSVITRPDGTKQAALRGKPLYNMMIDAPGEANCQGAEGWWILHPDGSKNTNQTATK